MPGVYGAADKGHPGHLQAVTPVHLIGGVHPRLDEALVELVPEDVHALLDGEATTTGVREC